jgi:hypothetical protein
MLIDVTDLNRRSIHSTPRPSACALSVFPWVRFRSAKAATKMHTLLDLRGNIPTFIHISDGKMHEVNVLDILIPEAGSFYIMDRGFTDFYRWYTMHQAQAFL